MGEKHVVRFEPVGIEIEVDEDQTVLRAAAEQGITLMHGCKEGQCASCKSFVLEGEDIELDKYSTFALPDFELDEGFTLLCRAHVYEDVTIELLNYDEEMIRSGHPIQEAVAEVVSNELRHPRHAAPRPEAGRTDRDIAFWPGQYVDIAIPGTDETRSFSMANTSSKESGQLEFVIKVYPDGAVLALPGHAARRSATGSTWSARSASSRCATARLRHRLRRGRRRDGADPVPAAVPGREAAAPARRRTTTAPGPRSDLCFEKELSRARGVSWPNFTLRPGALRSRTRTNRGTARSA